MPLLPEAVAVGQEAMSIEELQQSIAEKWEVCCTLSGALDGHPRFRHGWNPETHMEGLPEKMRERWPENVASLFGSFWYFYPYNDFPDADLHPQFRGEGDNDYERLLDSLNKAPEAEKP